MSKRWSSLLNTLTMMLANYFKTGLRNTFRYKLFSFINVFGLAIAMSVCLFVILLLTEQYDYDRFHPEKDRIYRVLSHRPETSMPAASTPPSLALNLRSGYASIDGAVNLTIGVGGDAVVENKAVEMRGFFTDENFFSMFGFGLLAGDRITALARPHTIVISQKVANALFADGNALGKTIDFYDRGLHYLKSGKDDQPVLWGSFTVTGVLDPQTARSHLRFDVLMSQSTQRLLVADKKLRERNGWDDAFTYVRAGHKQTTAAVNAALQQEFKSSFGTNPDLKNFGLSAQPLTEITPGILVNQPPSFQLPSTAFYVLGFVSLVIMISACVNYANLSAARALTRLKEIGVRKVTGAMRRDLITQFLTESLLTNLFALILATGVVLIIRPAFTGLWLNRYLALAPDFDVHVFLYFATFALVVGLISGLGPALYLSRFQPLRALHSQSSFSKRKLGIRKMLNATQFVISLFFIVTSILVYRQYEYFLSFKYGFQPAGMINLALQGNDFERISHELYQTEGIASVSGSQYVPATGRTSGMELDDPQGGAPLGFRHLAASPGFLENMGLALIAGRDLPPTADSIGRQVIVNETAARRLGFDNPANAVGTTVTQSWNHQTFEVIGVVKDFWVKLPIGGDALEPLFVQNIPHELSYANIRLVAGREQEGLAALERTWKRLDPLHPLKYSYYEEELASTHAGIYDVVSIVGFLAFIAVTIACLGMLGMVTYAVERRRKEVGIRRVLGAEQRSIILMLSKEFLWVLFLAVCVGSPLSYFINQLWLQAFPTRAPFEWDIMITAVTALVSLGLVVIGSQSLAAARQNPVSAIREQ